jgi:hypothetical protein
MLALTIETIKTKNMGQAWDKRKPHDQNADSTENQKQNQQNSGNIGREEGADINRQDQNRFEQGQFGTTAERGSGSIGHSGHVDGRNESDIDYGSQGNNPAGNYTGNAEDNWKQGTEGSPGKGYSDAGTAGNAGPGGTSGQSGENYGTAGTSAESQGVSGTHRPGGDNYQYQPTANTTLNQGNTTIEGNPELNKPDQNKPGVHNMDEDFDDDDDPRNELL